MDGREHDTHQDATTQQGGLQHMYQMLVLSFLRREKVRSVWRKRWYERHYVLARFHRMVGSRACTETSNSTTRCQTVCLNTKDAGCQEGRWAVRCCCRYKTHVSSNVHASLLYSCSILLHLNVRARSRDYNDGALKPSSACRTHWDSFLTDLGN